MGEQTSTATVYVCSNRDCGAVYVRDPCGHCPACVKPNGSGWSTIPRKLFRPPQAERYATEEEGDAYTMGWFDATADALPATAPGAPHESARTFRDFIEMTRPAVKGAYTKACRAVVDAQFGKYPAHYLPVLREDEKMWGDLLDRIDRSLHLKF